MSDTPKRFEETFIVKIAAQHSKYIEQAASEISAVSGYGFSLRVVRAPQTAPGSDELERRTFEMWNGDFPDPMTWEELDETDRSRWRKTIAAVRQAASPEAEKTSVGCEVRGHVWNNYNSAFDVRCMICDVQRPLDARPNVSEGGEGELPERPKHTHNEWRQGKIVSETFNPGVDEYITALEAQRDLAIAQRDEANRFGHSNYRLSETLRSERDAAEAKASRRC